MSIVNTQKVKNSCKKIVSCTLAAIMLGAALPALNTAAQTEGDSIYGSFTVDDYAAYIDEHNTAKNADSTITLDALNCIEDISGILWSGDETKAVCIRDGDSGVSYGFTAAESGLYAIRITYNLGTDTLTDAEFSLKLNGTAPFESAERIKLKGCYADDGDFTFDSNGNHLRPMQKAVSCWQSVYLQETDGLYDTPYLFYINEGTNTLSISANKGDIAVSKIELVGNLGELPTYEQYKNDNAGKDNNGGEYIKKIQAEKPVLKSDPSLYAVYDRTDLATEPSSAANIVYNTIGQSNWQYDAQWIEWELEVQTSGYYQIGMRVRQDILSGFSTNRRIYIDGEIPFSELECVSFPYNRDWDIKLLGDSAPFVFYLEKGKHTLRMETVSGSIGEILRVLETEVYKLQYLYRNMIMITGTDPDPYRDYYLQNDIVGLLDGFKEISKTLREQKQKLDKIMGAKGSEGIVIEQMATFLESLIEKPSTIAKRLSTYNSYVSSLSGWIGSGRVQPLEIDYLFIKTENTANPKVSSGFFPQLFFSMKQIMMSFVTDYNTIGDSADFSQSINVWVGTGREQATTIKEMVMREFSRNTNIGVNVKLVTSSMLEAILAGKGPDAALFVGGDMPVNLAARNAIADISRFKDFKEVTENYYEASLVPFTYKDGTYALPLTQSFPMMFVRTDVLTDLEIDVNIDTWEEFNEILPILMRNNLQVGLGDTIQTIKASGSGNNYGHSFFTTLLLQNGQSFYNDSLTKTTFSEEAAIEAFTRWTNFYTKFSFDITYNFLTRFRTGEMPIALNSYATYNTLQVAAPEIRGLWTMLPIPGTKKEDGTVDRAVNSSMTAGIILKSEREELCWEFLKWFASNSVQTEYAYSIEALLGTSGRYSPANKNVISTQGWTHAELDALSEQWQAVREIPVIPSAYAVTRGITNAFRSVINNRENPRKTLLKYNNTMNDEIEYKWKEFGVEVEAENE